MTDGEKAQWRAWMDRKVDAHHPLCARLRMEPDCDCGAVSWSQWFDGDECLAVMSARTGPDLTTVAAKKCDCSQCNPKSGGDK